MEEFREILKDVLCERLEMAYFKLIEENEEVKKSIATAKVLSEDLYENQNIPKEVKRQIADYKDISNFIEREIQEFIYTEGIKDCIKLLKALGILT